MRSVGLDLCGNVRARKKLRPVFESSESLKKGSLQLGRGLQRSSSFRTQITHRLIHRQHVDSCPKTHYLVARRVKNPTCRVFGQKPNTSRIENSSAFLASVLLQHRCFTSPDRPCGWQPFPRSKTTGTVRVLQSFAATLINQVPSPGSRSKNFGWTRRRRPAPYCPEVVIPGASRL
ncbi:hypothetical protein DOCECA_15870 [Pseudomonas sp. E102]